MPGRMGFLLTESLSLHTITPLTLLVFGFALRTTGDPFSPQKMTTMYELMVIVSPALTEAQVSSLYTEIKEHLKDVTFEDLWGKRRTAYPIRKHQEGFYAVWNFRYDPQDLPELNDFLRLNAQVLRHLIITVPKDYKPVTFAEMEKGVTEFYESRKKKQKQQMRPAMPRAIKSEPAPMYKAAAKPETVTSAEAPAQVAEVKPKVAKTEAPAKSDEKPEQKDAIDKKLDKILFGDDLNF